MSTNQTVWLALTDNSHTDQIIAEALMEHSGSASSNYGEQLCTGGKPERFWQLPNFDFVRRLFADRLNKHLRFTIYLKLPNRPAQNVHVFVRDFVIKRRKKVYVQPTPPPPQEPSDF